MPAAHCFEIADIVSILRDGQVVLAGPPKSFTDAEIADLGFAIGVINAWNLVNAGMRNPIPASA